MMLLKYILLLIVIFIIFFIYCHISKLTTINNNLDIIQTTDPDPELIYELLDQHKPIIFQREIYYWKDINKLIGKPLLDIKNAISQHPDILYSTSIKNNLDPLNIVFSHDWNIDLRNVIMDDKSGIFFIKQHNLSQCFGCITGQFRIILSPNNESHFIEPFINNVSSKDAAELLDKNPPEFNFIEIIIRQGNVIYIPWGWCYFIYNPNPTIECVIVDAINQSIISNFVIQ